MRLKPMVSLVSYRQEFLRPKLKLHAAEAGGLSSRVGQGTATASHPAAKPNPHQLRTFRAKPTSIKNHHRHPLADRATDAHKTLRRRTVCYSTSAALRNQRSGFTNPAFRFVGPCIVGRG